MDRKEFINVSKRMVKEYFNKYIAEKEGIEKLSLSDICMVSFVAIDGDYKITLSTPISDGIYYNVTYNKDTDEIKSSLKKTYEKTYFKNKKGKFRR